MTIERIVPPLQRSLHPRLGLVLMLVLVPGWVGGCGSEPKSLSESPSSESPSSESPSSEVATGQYFVDDTLAWGLETSHQSGRSGQFHFPEINGGGAALFDFDQDGDLDAALASGGRFDASGAYEGAVSLWRNVGGRFEPLALEAELESSVEALYPTGFGTGDVDRDGRVDLLIAGWGGQRLWRSLGEGRFVDVTVEAGLVDGELESAGDRASRWGLSAAFVDLDHDGWLDLYVTRYVAYDPARPETCRHRLGGLDYCGPSSFRPLLDVVFRNRGADETGAPLFERPLFEQHADSTLIVPPAPGMGVAAIDVEGDGRLELYVANDQQANLLWQRLAERFENVALLAGSALDGSGKAEASMGVAVGDIDGDGHEDLVVSHLEDESHTVYRNDGLGGFSDATAAFGLATASLPATGFGLGLLDVDLDGDLDLFVANGAVTAREERLEQGDAFPYGQADQLFLNRGGESSPSSSREDVGAAVGARHFAEATEPALTVEAVSRGAAFGDVDDDGAVDILLTAVDGPARLLRGVVRGPWLGLRLVDTAGLDAIGARVRLRSTDGSVLLRHAHTDGSYLSASDPRVVFGLQDREPVDLEVRWPDGALERFEAPPRGRYSTIRQGDGVTL